MFKFLIWLARRRKQVTIAHGGRPVIRRWVLLSSRYLTIYLHHFLASDDGPILHNHATPTLTYVLRGWYREHSVGDKSHVLHKGQFKWRSPRQWHRVELVGSNRPWTLFISGRHHPNDARFLMSDGITEKSVPC